MGKLLSKFKIICKLSHLVIYIIDLTLTTRTMTTTIEIMEKYSIFTYVEEPIGKQGF